jgi:hypothetical protein
MVSVATDRIVMIHVVKTENYFQIVAKFGDLYWLPSSHWERVENIMETVLRVLSV